MAQAGGGRRRSPSSGGAVTTVKGCTAAGALEATRGKPPAQDGGLLHSAAEAGSVA